MIFTSILVLDFKEDNKLFFDLLKEENFDFSPKNIGVEIKFINSKIKIDFHGSSILDLKIASNAVIKSLEIINKTLNV